MKFSSPTLAVCTAFKGCAVRPGRSCQANRTPLAHCQPAGPEAARRLWLQMAANLHLPGALPPQLRAGSASIFCMKPKPLGCKAPC